MILQEGKGISLAGMSGTNVEPDDSGRLQSQIFCPVGTGQGEKSFFSSLMIDGEFENFPGRDRSQIRNIFQHVAVSFFQETVDFAVLSGFDAGDPGRTDHCGGAVDFPDIPDQGDVVVRIDRPGLQDLFFCPDQGAVFRKEKELSGNRCEEVVDAVVLPSAAHTYIDTLSAETADHIKISGGEDVGAVLYKCAVHIGCNQSDHGVLLLLV